MSNIGVIGAGAFGTALASVLANGGHKVTLWGRDASLMTRLSKAHKTAYLPDITLPDALMGTAKLSDLRGSDVVLIVVPAQVTRAVLQAENFTAMNCPILMCAKGIELESGASRGWRVTIYEKADTLAAEASGNPQGVIYPRLSVEASPLSQFNLSALLFATHFYGHFWDKSKSTDNASITGQRCGVLVLPEKDSDHPIFAKIADNFQHCRKFVSLLNNANIQALSGIPLDAKSALYFPSLGWIEPRKVCEQLTRHDNIRVEQADINELLWDSPGQRWLLKTANDAVVHTAETVVLANSHQVKKFDVSRHLPLKAIRGQISIASATQKSRRLKAVICGAGYLAPANNDVHTLGATYNLDTATEDIRDCDHQLNLDTLQDTDPALPALLGWAKPSSLNGRVNLRCTTPDYLPIIGPAPKFEDFLNDFASLRENARADIPHCGSYWPGLYLHCGLGSRGFTYAPLGAELLAGLINKDVPALSRDSQIALHPARFIIRDMKRKRI